jgi:ribose 1,5-bisphosphokinase PhnN
MGDDYPVVDEARTRYPETRVFLFVVDPSIMAQRLCARGREAPADVAGRLGSSKCIGPFFPGETLQLSKYSMLAHAFS